MLRKKHAELNVEEIINKGAGVAADKEKPKKWVNFTLRIRSDLLEKIDKELESRVGMSKTSWILEAIQEKLKEISCNPH
jgi:hypothetical protein